MHNTTGLPASDNVNGGVALSWNRSGGAGETNLWNLYDTSTLAFQFSQKTGAGTASDLMSIWASGQVGIGTVTTTQILDLKAPNAALAIWDSQSLTASAGGAVLLQHYNVSGLRATYAGINAYATNGATGGEVGDLVVKTARAGVLTEAGRFMGSGNLNLNGAADLGGNGRINVPAAGGVFKDGVEYATAGAAAGWTDGGAEVHLTITTDRVGIGTTAASTSKFEVQGNLGVTGVSAGVGDAILIYGGAGAAASGATAAGIGGTLTYVGGTGGAASVTSGNAAAGGGVNITGGIGGSATVGGTGNAAVGGGVYYAGGAGGAGTATKVAGQGGPITIRGGAAGANNGAGGAYGADVDIDGGAGTGAGLGGAVLVGFSTARTVILGRAGGSVYVYSPTLKFPIVNGGASYTIQAEDQITAYSGVMSITLKGGNGANASGGGNVTIQSGSGYAPSNGPVGDVNIYCGVSSGTGRSGDINLNTNVFGVGSGRGGNINLTSGSGSTAGGGLITGQAGLGAAISAGGNITWTAGTGGPAVGGTAAGAGGVSSIVGGVGGAAAGSTGAAGAGGVASVLGGAGATANATAVAGAGGAINVIGGAGGNANAAKAGGAGGAGLLQGGTGGTATTTAGGTSGVGGALVYKGGTGGTGAGATNGPGAGGAITVSGGDGGAVTSSFSGAAGGMVNVTGGAATGTDTAGGTVFIDGGLGRGAGAPGVVSIRTSMPLGTGSTLQTIATRLSITGTTNGSRSSFSGQYYSNQTTCTVTLDWDVANVQYIVLANGGQPFTFANPQAGAPYTLILKQPAAGAAGTVTWPATVLWSGGIAPTLTATNGKVDVITFVYDGTNAKYYGFTSLNH